MPSTIETQARKLAKKIKAKTDTHADRMALVKAVKACDEDVENAEVWRDRAKARWEREGEIEIDDEAVVSESSDGGAYVQAWVWVDKG